MWFWVMNVIQKNLAEVENCLALANLGELYKNLPRGLKSQIGELGGMVVGRPKATPFNSSSSLP